MFKKLKEKITEEVKSSPQRFAEFTQSVSDKLQSNSSTDDNFFSIGEDDANTSMNSAEQGFSSVALVSPSQESRPRRNSNISIASDVSFLPRYESGNMYHLQSDLDVSASEIEDNASTSSSQIGHLSKEQIHSAFQKSQLRYHKYRGRYTDLARHYKELERENAKMKSVLVETQDKAIRRVTELKEQCNLEQKAKAHLEAALRDEMDEKNFKIHSLQTQIGLLQGVDTQNLLVNIDSKENNQGENIETLTKYLNDARKEIEALNERIQEIKANSIVFQSKEQEYKTRIGNLEREINQYSEREKENNLKLAQNKMELHNEILSKDTEMTSLKKENDTLRHRLESVEAEIKVNGGVKLDNLQSQNKKLIDKVENLTQKCNNLENDLLKVEKYKLEIRELSEREEQLKEELAGCRKISEERLNLVKHLKQGLASCKNDVNVLSTENSELRENLTKERKQFENQILTIREEAKKGLLSLEPKIREKLQNEYLRREEDLKLEFSNKVGKLSSEKETQLQIFEKDDYIKELTEELNAVKQELSKKVEEYYNLEKNHLELIEESTRLRNTIYGLEKENSSVEGCEEKIGRLEAHIATLQEELRELGEMCEKKEKENVFLSQENLGLQQNFKESSGKLRLYEEKYEAIQMESSESKLLELKVQKLEEEKRSLLQEFEVERKMYNEMLIDHRDLKEREEVIMEMGESLNKLRHEMNHLSENLDLEREKNVQLYDKKHNLELEVEKLAEKVRIYEEKGEARNIDSSECGILKLKLQSLEEENKRLRESFENERKSFTNELEDIKEDLMTNELVKGDDQTRELRGKLHDVRRLSEHKEVDNIYLAEENMKLQEENTRMGERLRVLEEKLETVQMDGTESKLLELKVQRLEEEHENMSREFEMERTMFNNLLENDKEIIVKEEIIEQLQEDLRNCHQEIIRFKERLVKEEEENVRLGKEKLSLERAVEKLNEKVRIAEEREEAVALDKSEASLLELKLGKLEEENRALQESFEVERKCFDKCYEEHAKHEEKIRELMEENEVMVQKEKQLKDKQLQRIEELMREVNDAKEKLGSCMGASEALRKEKEGYVRKLEGVLEENRKLGAEVEEKERKVSELSNNISQLSDVIQKQTGEFNGLLERTQQLEGILEKIQNDSADAIKEEKGRQNELTLKIAELQRELDDKAAKFLELNDKLAELEEIYARQKGDYKEKEEEVESLRRKIAELQALESSLKTMGEEKRAVENSLQAVCKEKSSLESELGQFKATHSELLKKFRVAEQSRDILKQEKDSLMGEIKDLRFKIEELSRVNNSLAMECSRAADSDYALEQLKNQNEVLQNESDSLAKEITELNVRLGQISSDNRAVEEENQSLILANEELKIKLESLETEKRTIDQIRLKLTTDNEDLIRIVDELKEARKINSELACNGPDISKIQQDFYEIKEKCDGLFVENMNLKSEYAKLEEKCNDFSKVRRKLETQIGELERQYTEIQHEKQLLQDEIQELKISPVNAPKLERLELLQQETCLADAAAKENVLKEIEILRDKLAQYKSLDITNKSSIEFYENELQKIKNQNEKLNRKLDETLVTLNHCAELSTSTEVEYLKNVLYNYMLGKESLVLARVIAAVCKFDPEQTETVLQREQQKQTLLGQLGLI